MNAIRVIEGNAQPGEPFWRFVDAAKAESGETEVEFFGPISEYSWFGDEITPKAFKDALNEQGKGGPVTIKVNSPGGEVFAAAAIRNIIRDYPGRVTADIIGLAASAATVVVSGADQVRMRDTAMFMIHDPSTVAWGTIEDMQQVVDILRQVKETILNGYQAKTGMERDRLAQMMTDETWMTARQAKEYGFVDEVVTDAAKPAKLPKGVKAAFLNCLNGYGKAPEEIVHEWERMELPEDESVIAKEAEEVMTVEAAASEQAETDNGAAEEQARRDDEAQALRNYLDIFGPR
jgi:ATP-dependent Clp protease, protease subunit